MFLYVQFLEKLYINTVTVVVTWISVRITVVNNRKIKYYSSCTYTWRHIPNNLPSWKTPQEGWRGPTIGMKTIPTIAVGRFACPVSITTQWIYFKLKSNFSKQRLKEKRRKINTRSNTYYTYIEYFILHSYTKYLKRVYTNINIIVWLWTLCLLGNSKVPSSFKKKWIKILYIVQSQ